MKKVYTIIFLSYFSLMFTFSCKPKPIKFDNLISKDSLIKVSELEEIMYEIFLAEAAIYKEQMQAKDVNYYTQLYYYNIFNKHNINRAQLMRSISYYIVNQEIEEIYRNVITKLRKLDSSLQHENELIESKE